MVLRAALKLFCSAILLWGFGWTPATATPSAAPRTTRIEDGVATALQQLQRFTASHSLDDLRSSIYKMQSAMDIDALTPQNFIAQRRIITSGYAQIISAVERSYDQTFDPSRRLACPVPPRDYSGMQLMPCADPSEVRDPSIRAQYRAALERFQRYERQAIYYYQLRNVDALATTSLGMALDLLRKVSPEGATADFTALDQIVQQAGVSGARRKTIDAMFYARPGR